MNENANYGDKSYLTSYFSEIELKNEIDSAICIFKNIIRIQRDNQLTFLYGMG